MHNSSKGALTALALTALLAVAGTAAQAQTQVTHRLAQAGDDTLDWRQLGPDGTTLGNPIMPSTLLGQTVTVTNPDGGFERLDQGIGWNGNFAPNDALLYNLSNGPITLTFGQDVAGLGANIQSHLDGSYTGELQIFDDLGNSLGSFTEDGTANGDNDGSAIYIGLQDASANIHSATFSLTSAPLGSVSDFAINDVSLNAVPAAVPEASTTASFGLLLALGLGGLVLAAKRKKTAKASA